MELILNTAEEQLLVTTNSNFRKPYFTLWKKKTKYEIYFAPATNLKLEGSSTEVCVQVPSIFNKEKCGLQNISKGKFQAPSFGANTKCLGLSPHYVWITLLLKAGPCNSFWVVWEMQEEEGCLAFIPFSAGEHPKANWLICNLSPF